MTHGHTSDSTSQWMTWPNSPDRLLARRYDGDRAFYIAREDPQIANRGQLWLMDGDRVGFYGDILAVGHSVEELMSIADEIAGQPKRPTR